MEKSVEGDEANFSRAGELEESDIDVADVIADEKGGAGGGEVFAADGADAVEEISDTGQDEADERFGKKRHDNGADDERGEGADEELGLEGPTEG